MGEIRITQSKYKQIGGEFGGNQKKRKGDRSTWKDDSALVGGDPYDYFHLNEVMAIVPVIRDVSFDNRAKAVESWTRSRGGEPPAGTTFAVPGYYRPPEIMFNE